MSAWGLCLLAGFAVAYLSASRINAQVDYPRTPTQTCNCPLDFRPVCGSNAKTYNNACHLRCELAYTPGLMQLSEGVCGSNSQVVGPFTSGVSPSGVGYPYGSQPASTYPGYSDYGSTCSWGCPAVSVGSVSGQPNWSSTYGTSFYVPPYGGGGAASSLYVASSNTQVCDHRGNVYANDCLYYRAVCEAERRQDFLMKRTCTAGVTSTVYEGFNPSRYRSGTLLANEVVTTTTSRPVPG
ncbi:hypothetical protein RvY_01048 [Ramazzottius varieornatus]|uniref:Kazal-like domain-containing protein n=1 Tax=Ramazzottius varieornatus TaxID=947166 RepID=A0A1D1UL16_RAMVA|nr:hypothetical protein RvY_01048 [Ramazzottius varieornatus]